MEKVKTIIKTPKAPSAIGPYSQAVLANGMLFISGQVPLVVETMKVVEGGIKEQTKQVFENIKAILEEAGMSFVNVIKMNVLLTDMGDFKDVNDIYATYYESDFPARAAYQVVALPLGVMIEIETIAVQPKI